MQPAPVPACEQARLEALRRYQILDTKAEKIFDDITALAAEVCRAPISLLTFVDSSRQWFKSSVGLAVHETPRSASFCAHAINYDDAFIIPDASADPRFADHPMVQGEPKIRFYAGIPLLTPERLPIGTLCVIDCVPRELSPEQKAKLRALAEGAMLLLEMRRSSSGDRAPAGGSDH